MKAMSVEKDIKKEVNELLENEIGEEGFEEYLQMKINEFSCLSRDAGVERPGQFPDGRRTSSHLVFPILVHDGFSELMPQVIGLVFTGLAGKTVFFGCSAKDLEDNLMSKFDELLTFEGLPTSVNWDPIDVFLSSKHGLILLPSDVIYARAYGWRDLMEKVRTGERTSNYLVVSKMGRMALVSDTQKEAFKKIKMS